MSDYVDYTPTLEGLPYDPQQAGGGVDSLRLYDRPSRTGQIVASAGPAVRRSPGVYRFTIPDLLMPGRYWTEIVWRKDAASVPFTDVGDRLDLPFYDTLVVGPEDVAARLGVTPPMPADVRERLVDAISDAQDDVAAELNRPVLPRVETVTGVRPVGMGALLDASTWPLNYGDITQVVAYTANADGTFDLTVRVGLDGRSTPAIRRYVLAHAAELIRQDPVSGIGERRVQSVAAEGQSVSYSNDSTVEGAAGSLPTLKSLRPWKRRAVYQRPSPKQALWPYNGGYRGPR